jgi:hypothetical protein
MYVNTVNLKKMKEHHLCMISFILYFQEETYPVIDYLFLQSKVSKKLSAAIPDKSSACLAPSLPCPASKCL